MLIEFSVENFRSFREMQTLHLQAAPIKSKNSKLDEQNVCRLTDKLSVVKSKVIYGANASGKSNLVKAMATFVRIFRHSLQDATILQASLSPHLMDTESFKKPTFFQILFRLDDRNYRYGFEATGTAIVSEWLYSSDGKKPESYHFRRNENGIEVNPRTFKEGARLIIGKDEMPPLYRSNALFLPLVAAFNGPTALRINRYFLEHYAVYSGIEDILAQAIAMEAFREERMREKMADVLKQADLGIEDLGNAEIAEEDLSGAAREYYQKMRAEGKKPFVVVTKRSILDQTGKHKTEVPFFLNEESYGTQKLFWMSPFLINTLEHGGVLVVDEFGSSMHVQLIRAIVELFHSPVTNPHNAQLIAATHDTHLLDQGLFRRDQIAFVEKSRSGQSILTDLVEFKGVRNDASLETDYLHGRYGAVPLTNQFDWAFTFETNGKTRQENGSE
ncbi:MAG: ATP-binding protein [Saprospiraceae bacterium]|nr:ATP-binding protein [Saprospiraceae bacterium]